jgi:hypothetical protein
MAAPFAKGPYAPVGMAFSENSQTPWNRLFLLGGSQGGTWFRHTDLTITVQGVAVTPENAMDFENGEDLPCETLLAAPGLTFALYGADGKKGESVIKRTLFFTHPAAGELFLAVEFENFLEFERGLIVGINGDWDAMPVKTNRVEDEGSITFSTTGVRDDSPASSVVLTRTVDSEGETFFKGEQVIGGKIYDAGSFYTDDPQTVAGFFIDLNGDGVMEFVISVQGIAGSAGVFVVEPDAAKEVMYLDFGD